MLRHVPALTLALIPACPPAEGSGWRLTSVDCQGPKQGTTLLLDRQGRLSGHPPCNRHSGSITGSMPNFNHDTVMCIEMPCLDLPADERFFSLLRLRERADQTHTTQKPSGVGHAPDLARP